MKAQLYIEIQPRLRDALLAQSKVENLRFDAFIRKVLRDYLWKKYLERVSTQTLTPPPQ